MLKYHDNLNAVAIDPAAGRPFPTLSDPAEKLRNFSEKKQGKKKVQTKSTSENRTRIIRLRDQSHRHCTTAARTPFFTII